MFFLFGTAIASYLFIFNFHKFKLWKSIDGVLYLGWKAQTWLSAIGLLYVLVLR